MNNPDLVATFEQQLASREFEAAAHTLKQFEPADSDQVQILTALLFHRLGNQAKAELIYRELLKSQTSPKILNQARQGLQEILDTELRSQQQKIAQATASDGGDSLGFLLLQPLPINSDKKAAATKIARILHIDAYSAQTWIPSRQPKIVRLGIVGELTVYANQLRSVGIHCFWFSLRMIAQIPIYAVSHFELPSIHGLVAIANDGERLEFQLPEVKQRLEANIPIFSKVAILDAKFQAASKEQILDRIQVCDLHLVATSDRPACILRFHDHQYQFEQGMQVLVPRVLPHLAPTIQERWASLMQWWLQAAPQAICPYEFSAFAEIMLGYPDLLKESVDAKLDLSAPGSNANNYLKTNSWDRCFQLFSGMIFGL